MELRELIAQITEILSPCPYILDEWQSFLSKAQLPTNRTDLPHEFFIKRIVIEGHHNYDRSFKQGINEVHKQENEDDLELFSILKLAFTGKNQLSRKRKEEMDRVLVEMLLDEETLTSEILMNKSISCTIYLCSMDEILSKGLHNHRVLLSKNKLSNIQKSLKKFFSKNLGLPYLQNASYQNHHFHKNPITFATYYSFLSLDSTRLFKAFSEDQSNYWRKRCLQILIGLEGIPYISFFQSLLAEIEYYEPQITHLKNTLKTHLISINKEKQLPWQKRFLRLKEQKKTMKELKKSLNEDIENHYHYDIELKIEKEAKELHTQIHQRQTKEILILQEIQHLGGDFKPKKHKKQNENEFHSERQFNLFLSNPNQNDKNKERIEQLIGDYYLNLSQIEVLEIELEDLNIKKKTELGKTLDNEKQNAQNMNGEIELIHSEIDEIIIENREWILNEFDKSQNSLNKDMVSRNYFKEKQKVKEILEQIKSFFKSSHETKLLSFFQCLKTNLTLLGSPDIQCIALTQNYMPKITYESHGEILFPNLPEKQKLIFILGLHLSLLQFSLEYKAFIPSFLLLDISTVLTMYNDLNLNKINKILEQFKGLFQIIIT